MPNAPEVSDHVRQKRQEREAFRTLIDAARTDPAARQEVLARREARTATLIARGDFVPPWIRYMETDYAPWGFLIYRCACYKNPARWELYRAALDQVWEDSWQNFWENQKEIGLTEEMYEGAKRQMKLRWVEDERLEGHAVDEVRRRFKMARINYHMDSEVCLFVDEASVSSLIGPLGQEVQFPDELHNQEVQTRDSFINAVDSEYSSDYEGCLPSRSAEPYKGWAKVFTQVVFTELCPRRTYYKSLITLDEIYQESYALPPGNGIWFEAFCQYRHSLGLRGSVLCISLIYDVGYVAENAWALRNVKIQGLYTLGEKGFLESVEDLLLNLSPVAPKKANGPAQINSVVGSAPLEPWEHSSQVVMGLRSELHLDDTKNTANWRRDRRMGMYHNLPMKVSSQVSSESSRLKLLRDELAGADDGD